MPPKRGPKAAIVAAAYRNVATGNAKHGTPDWKFMELVRDATAPQPWEMSPADVRATRVRLYHPTQKDLTPTLIVRMDDADPDYLALRAAAEQGTALDLLILDGPRETEGSRGTRGWFHLSLSAEDQTINAVLYASFDLRPGFGVDDDGDPYYPKVAVAGAAGAITYTDHRPGG